MANRNQINKRKGKKNKNYNSVNISLCTRIRELLSIMRIVNIIGCVCFFFPLFYKYQSYRALLVLINGILFHSNENNHFLRLWDISCNIFMCFYTYYVYKMAMFFIIFSFTFFLFNWYFSHTKTYSLIVSDLLHIIFVQLPLSICLFLSLSTKV